MIMIIHESQFNDRQAQAVHLNRVMMGGYIESVQAI